MDILQEARLKERYIEDRMQLKVLDIEIDTKSLNDMKVLLNEVRDIIEKELAKPNTYNEHGKVD